MSPMHVIDTGTGTPLVLLPAFPFDSRMWDRLRPGLAELARVITPDPRGFGKTPIDGAKPDLGVLAADVVGLLDRLELDKVVVGGCSMGTYVAMAVFRAAPERVSALLVIDGRQTADPPEGKENRLATAARAERDGVAWLPEEMPQVLLGPTTLERRADVVDTVRHLLSTATPEAVAWAQRAMAARPDATAVLRDADIPALIIHGEEDALIPVTAAHTLAELLPRAELVVLPECGHLPPLERPAEVTSTVSAWLSQV